MEFKYIKFESKGNWVSITLNRQDVLNSFNREMAFETQQALDLCHNDSNIRAILITGAGKAFTAGQDLSEAISGQFEVEQIVREHYNPIISKIRAIEKPVVAAVNGVAAGAGANLAFACDIVVASEKASFIQSFSKIGLIPDSGGTYFLPRLVGLGKTAALMFLGDKVSAEEAEKINLIYKCVKSEEFDTYINNLMEKLSNMPTYGIGLTKRALNHTFGNSLLSQLDLEERLQALAGSSNDYKEGVNAFLEKRNPNFKGN